MVYKYMISTCGQTVGVKYDGRKLKLTIGGHELFYDLMFALVDEYFKVNDGGEANCDRLLNNKCRFSFNNIKMKKFIDGLAYVKEHMDVEQVQILGRVMS